MAQKTLTGARCQFFLNSKPMGFAANVSITENYNQEPIVVLNQLIPVEFATTGYTVQLQCRVYRIPNQDLVNAGLWPENGRTADDTKRLILNFEPMTADVYDGTTGTFVGKLWGVVPVTRTIDIQARGVVLNNCTFNAIGYADEGSTNV